MNCEAVAQHISDWLKSYCQTSGTKGFVIGISGGIDSAVTSTLCAHTGIDVIAVNMPIKQKESEYKLAIEQVEFLKSNFSNCKDAEVDLTNTLESFANAIPNNSSDHKLAMANSRARLRMTTLYAIGQANGLLVAGTGNKIEDFGIGFFTKYGDGGVDLSPIADLTKSQVFELAQYLEIPKKIQNAKPTDGLWDDDRNDEEQIGATYPELEWAMQFSGDKTSLDNRQKEVLEIYTKLHNANKHKMIDIPVCIIPSNLF